MRHHMCPIICILPVWHSRLVSYLLQHQLAGSAMTSMAACADSNRMVRQGTQVSRRKADASSWILPCVSAGHVQPLGLLPHDDLQW